jgi:hypothetical protein
MDLIVLYKESNRGVKVVCTVSRKYGFPVLISYSIFALLGNGIHFVSCIDVKKSIINNNNWVVKLIFSFVLSIITGGSPVFLNHEPMIPKDFPSRSTCFADILIFFRIFRGDLWTCLICRIWFRLSCISSNADDSLVIKCYLVLIEFVKYILCFSSLYHLR